MNASLRAIVPGIFLSAAGPAEAQNLPDQLQGAMISRPSTGVAYAFRGTLRQITGPGVGVYSWALRDSKGADASTCDATLLVRRNTAALNTKNCLFPDGSVNATQCNGFFDLKDGLFSGKTFCSHNNSGDNFYDMTFSAVDR